MAKSKSSKSNGNALVIVESPAKAKTINKYLGKDFTVLASYGHVRDLVPKEGAVEPEHRFRMHYEDIEKNEKHIEAIARAAKSATSAHGRASADRSVSVQRQSSDAASAIVPRAAEAATLGLMTASYSFSTRSVLPAASSNSARCQWLWP